AFAVAIGDKADMPQFFMLSDLVMQSVALPGKRRAPTRSPEQGQALKTVALSVSRKSVRPGRKARYSGKQETEAQRRYPDHHTFKCNGRNQLPIERRNFGCIARFNAKRISAASMRPRPPFSMDHTAARA